MSWAEFTLDTLIDDWGKWYLVSKESNKGDYGALGIYKEPEEKWNKDFGIIATMINKVLMPVEFGGYTQQDYYCITRSNYQVGNWIKDGKLLYKIHERADYSYFDQTDLLVYKIKLDNGRLDNSDD